MEPRPVSITDDDLEDFAPGARRQIRRAVGREKLNRADVLDAACAALAALRGYPLKVRAAALRRAAKMLAAGSR